MGVSLKNPTGIDGLLGDSSLLTSLKEKRVGLLTNQSSLTAGFVPTAHALHDALRDNLVALFSPEHGWSGSEVAGEDVGDAQETHTQLPVFSLYGPLLETNLEHIKTLDVLIIDIQDVGVRCYTYAATCAKVLEYISREKLPLKCIICDRPNPLGKTVQGPGLDPSYKSIVGYLDVPFQHGNTMGELLKHHNDTLEHPVSLSVIPSSTQLDLYVPPSPGLPDNEAIFLYPGLVLLEGVNASEGRGTSFPFKCVAAPHLDGKSLTDFLNGIAKSGIKARPFQYAPISGKFAGKLCFGAQLHVTDFQKINGFRLGLHILHYLRHQAPEFEWVSTKGKYWIDLLAGGTELRESVNQGTPPEEILELFSHLSRNL